MNGQIDKHSKLECLNEEACPRSNFETNKGNKSNLCYLLKGFGIQQIKYACTYIMQRYSDKLKAKLPRDIIGTEGTNSLVTGHDDLWPYRLGSELGQWA